MLSFSEKVRVILKRKGMTLGELSELTGQSRQNLSNKLSRNNFTEEQMIQIATALNCSYESHLTLNDTQETF